MSNHVTIYTDGACRGNGKTENVGAYGIILMDDNGSKKEIKKAIKNTTNNIMELGAVIQSLRLLKQPCNVDLYSDSAYVVEPINQKWLVNWQKNGWRKSDKSAVKNQSMWVELLELMKTHNVTVHKVKGHSDNEHNNRCDQLANEAMDEMEV